MSINTNHNGPLWYDHKNLLFLTSPSDTFFLATAFLGLLEVSLMVDGGWKTGI